MSQEVPVPTCPGCQRRDGTIARLQQQVADLQRQLDELKKQQEQSQKHAS